MEYTLKKILPLLLKKRPKNDEIKNEHKQIKIGKIYTFNYRFFNKILISTLYNIIWDYMILYD